MAAKKYFFIRFTKKGRTYYKNQDGKQVSAEKVKSGKRPVYDLVQKGPDKGKLIKPERASIKPEKRPKTPKVSNFEVKNTDIAREINRAVKKGYEMYIEKNGKVYKLEGKKAIGNFALYNYSNNQNFYRNMKKKTDSPLYKIGISEDAKGKRIVFSLTNELKNEELNSAPEIKKAMDEFSREEDKIFKKFFKSKKKPRK